MDDRKVVVEFSFKTIFWVLMAVLALWLVVTLKDVLVVVLLSFILATAISPFVDYLQSKKVPRTLSVAGVILAIVAIIVLIFRVVVPPFVTEINNILSNRGEYIDKITSYFQALSPQVRDSLSGFLNTLMGNLGNLNVGGVVSGARGVVNGIVETVIVFALSFYMLQSNRGVEGVITAYTPKQHQRRVLSIYRKISKKMSQWMRGQILLGLIIFSINLVGLTVLRVDYALTLAVLSGVLEILPIIGPIVSGGLAVTIALTQSPLLALIVLGWYILIQQLENHILVPQVMKKSLGLNPVVVILSLIIGGKLLGIVGILVSVPIAAAIGVLLEEFIKKQEEEAK